MGEDVINKIEVNINKGGQVNYASDNSTIYASQNIIIDTSSFQKK